jgi:hypothetical protein
MMMVMMRLSGVRGRLRKRIGRKAKHIKRTRTIIDRLVMVMVMVVRMDVVVVMGGRIRLCTF